MERKRHAPEAALDQVVRAIEREDASSHRQAVLALLSHGPLIVTPALLDVLDNRMPPEDVMLFRAELLAFLRTVVREGGAGAVLRADQHLQPCAVRREHGRRSRLLFGKDGQPAGSRAA